jgi:hypothetical protein
MIKQRRQLRHILNKVESKASFGDSLHDVLIFKRYYSERMANFIKCGKTRIRRDLLEYIEFEILPRSPQHCIDLLFKVIEQHDEDESL